MENKFWSYEQIAYEILVYKTEHVVNDGRKTASIASIHGRRDLIFAHLHARWIKLQITMRPVVIHKHSAYLVHKCNELTNFWVGCMFIPLRMLRGKFKCMLERLKILYVNRLQRKKRWANGISSRIQYERTNWRGGISFSNYLFKDLFNSQHSYNTIFNAIKMGLSTIYRKNGYL